MRSKMFFPLQWVGEQAGSMYNSFVNFDVSRLGWFSNQVSKLRSFVQEAFFHRPIAEGTLVNFDLARSLYRNDNDKYSYGAGFVRPMIDLTVEYMGIPAVTGENGDNETFLNECIRDYWAPSISQIFRDAMRDSKVIMRYYQPRIDNPLFTIADKQHGSIQVIPAEIVQLTFDPVDPCLVIRAVITHFYEFDQRTMEEIALGIAPRMYTHEIMEIIDQSTYTYFDKTAGAELESWATPNIWKFVPVWPVWNEYAADLGGGQSDIEPVMPFIEAFHSVTEQTLAAHKYHSTPKAFFNVKDITQFLANNFPDVLDENNKIKQGAKIKWSGREIFFMATDEEAGFIEAKSVLGDSKTLLEFLIDCICIVSQTPKWAYFNDATAHGDNAEVQVFEKKINRKRLQFTEFIVMCCKMALVVNGKTPDTPRLSWPIIRLDDLASKGQALQQIIMGLDVAASHEWIADETSIKILSSFFPELNSPDVEKQLAAKNVVPEVAAPAPASDTQGAQSGAPSSNGAKTKPAAKKALATATGKPS